MPPRWRRVTGTRTSRTSTERWSPGRSRCMSRTCGSTRVSRRQTTRSPSSGRMETCLRTPTPTHSPARTRWSSSLPTRSSTATRSSSRATISCSVAQYWCYNSMPGFVPYAPHPGCDPGDTYGRAVVPAPTLPDPGYLAPSTGYYTLNQGYNQDNRGTWTEMYPGHYGTFHLSGGSASCAFLNGGVYTWTNGYQSDANGSLLSNELKAPDEQLATAPGRTNVANPQFWDMNGTNCAGHFTVTNSA